MVTDAGRKAVRKYKSTKQKALQISFKKPDYDEIIQPAIEKSGLPVATYIKQAVFEKIENDKQARHPD